MSQFLPILLIPLLAASAATAASLPLDQRKLATLDAFIEKSIADQRFTGAVLRIQHGHHAHLRAYGNRSVTPSVQPMKTTTVFDVASLTKVTATAPSIMVLIDRGLIDPKQKVKTYLPEFQGTNKDKITVRHLLTHFSGLPPVIPRKPEFNSYNASVAYACSCELRERPGTRFRYSDVNYITLAEIVRRVSGQPIEQFSKNNLFTPLGMADTTYNPPRSLRHRIAPTEKTTATGLLHGVVHDPSARAMGGATGHAGLFSSINDLARYCTAIIGGGRLGNHRVLTEKSVREMTKNQSPWRKKERRGYGWDIDTAYSPRGEHFSKSTFGHTGWTGHAMWIDPKNATYVILLTTRNHPFERKSIKDVRHTVFTLAAEAAHLD